MAAMARTKIAEFMLISFFFAESSEVKNDRTQTDGPVSESFYLFSKIVYNFDNDDGVTWVKVAIKTIMKWSKYML